MRDEIYSDGINFRALFSEGSAAFFSEFMCYPTHTVWTVQQEIAVKKNISFLQTCHVIHKSQQGYKSLYKGFSISGVSAVLGIYPYLVGAHYAKIWFGDNHLGEFMQGIIAQCLASTIWIPATHIIELEQATITCAENKSFQKLSAIDKTKFIYKQSGIKGFYRSPWSQVSANAIDDAVGFWFRARILNCYSKDQQKQIVPQIISTFLGFGLAGVLTTPMSVVQSRIRLHEANPNAFPDKKFVPALMRLYKQSGFRGLFNGASTSALYGAITSLPVITNAVSR